MNEFLKSVLLTGASGYVGGRLLPLLESTGSKVRCPRQKSRKPTRPHRSGNRSRCWRCPRCRVFKQYIRRHRHGILSCAFDGLKQVFRGPGSNCSQELCPCSAGRGRKANHLSRRTRRGLRRPIAAPSQAATKLAKYCVQNQTVLSSNFEPPL